MEMGFAMRSDSSNDVPGRMIRVAVGYFFAGSMAWICLSERRFWELLWPRDIQATIVNWLGGTIRTEFDGRSDVALPWIGASCGLLILSAASAFSFELIARMFSSRASTEIGKSATFQGFGHDVLLRFLAVGAGFVWSGLWLLLWLTSFVFPDGFVSSFLAYTPALLPAMSVAWALTAGAGPISALKVIGKRESASSSLHSDRRGQCIWIVVTVLVFWTTVSFWMNERLYAGLWIPHGDSAMYEEHLWNVWHGKGFRSYLDQGLFLGEHIQVIHLLLLPLHMIWPHHLLLELAESLSLAICAVPIFRLARRASGSDAAAMWLALAWLFFFPMHFLDIAIDIKTLRPGCYGLPFLFFALDAAEGGRLKTASILLIIALSAQEDFALVIAPVGLVFWFQNRPRRKKADGDSSEPGSDRSPALSRWGGCVFLLTVLYLLAVVLFVIPAFRGGAPVHYSRYFGDLGNSPGDLIRTTLRDPGKVLSQFFCMRTLWYLLVFCIPTGLLPLRAPMRLIAGLGTFAMISLIQLGSSSGSEEGIFEPPPVPYHHFHTPLLPVLFWAAAGGLKGLSASGTSGASTKTGAVRRESGAESRSSAGNSAQRSSAEMMAQFAFFSAILTGVTSSMMPFGATFWSQQSRTGYNALYVPGPRAAEFSKVIKLLNPNSRVASTDYVHTRLTHFERSYDYSDYPRAVNQYQPGVPPDTDMIVIDTQHPYSRIRKLDDVPELKKEPEEWEVLPDETNGYFIVLKRKR